MSKPTDPLPEAVVAAIVAALAALQADEPAPPIPRWRESGQVAATWSAPRDGDWRRAER